MTAVSVKGNIENVAQVWGKETRQWLEKYLPSTEPGVRGRLARLAALHEKYNDRGGLSAQLTAEKYVLHLVVDSLKLVELLTFEPGETLADVGSGGGYPGLPVAIARSDLAITLIEPNQRKAAYLLMAARVLGLGNVAVKAIRAEEDAACYDVATAKAVGKPPATLAVLLPRLRPGGRAAVFVGPTAAEGAAWEDAAAAAGARITARHGYTLPGHKATRYILELTT